MSGRRIALLVATHRYQDASLRQLAAPAADATALAELLRDPQIAGFDVTVLTNEPHYVVGEAIGEFYRDRQRDDLALLYFTGHGLKDDDGRLYLAMANTKSNGLLFTGLPAEQINEAMQGCVSRQKVLILDCCYGGAFPAGRTAKGDSAVHTFERFGGKGSVVLTASDATQYSFEDNALSGQGPRSLFTHFLIEGIRTGGGDLDGDGDISLDELYTFVHDRVVDEMPQQRPKIQQNVEGRIVIARNVRWTLPRYLSNAIESPLARDRLAAIDGLSHLYRVGNTNVRGCVVDQVRKMTDDDSRSVSAAATRFLTALSTGAGAPVAETSPAPTEKSQPSAEPRPGPDRRDTIREALSLWQGCDGVYFAPAIPARRLEMTSKALNVPSDEEIVVFVNLSMFGYKDALLFGLRGMYARNMFQSPRVKHTAYETIKGLEISSTPAFVGFMIGNAKFSTSGAKVPNESFVDALRSLQRALD